MGEPKQAALAKPAAPALTGPRHTLEAARQLFEKKDRDHTGYLEVPQLLSVAEELWRTSHPRDPLLSSDSIDVSAPRGGGRKGWGGQGRATRV